MFACRATDDFFRSRIDHMIYMRHPLAVREALGLTLNKAKRIVAQSGQPKSVDGPRKLYAWHAREVDGISKGKARALYEFEVKVGIASTLQGNLIVGAPAFRSNPYDGHMLN